METGSFSVPTKMTMEKRTLSPEAPWLEHYKFNFLKKFSVWILTQTPLIREQPIQQLQDGL